MLLTSIEIQNYRSVFGEKLVLPLAKGMNAVVGPNNVGKSNIFRALATAFESGRVFDRRKDWPPMLTNVKPTVTMTFALPKTGRTSSERTLARYLEEYERAVNPAVTKTHISGDEIKFRVVMERAADGAGSLTQYFVTAGAGGRFLKDNDELLVKTLKQFKRCVHFVYIESGQSLTSLLEGKFRDILQSVIKEQLATEYAAAEQDRQTYVSGIRTKLLDPLTNRIGLELKDLIPEISEVQLEPYVSGLEETLTKMGVSVNDAALTDLAEKGTGVRGGVLIAMLRHLADEGRRSMIFVVEEPEAFLHPAAQESMREDLEAIAEKPNVSLLVSTHSPFIVSRQPSSRIFSVAKESNGRTFLSARAEGDAPHASMLGSLFRGRLVMEVLDRAQLIPEKAKAILVVEGYTDYRYIQTAARLLGLGNLSDDLAIIQAGAGVSERSGGASLSVMQAIVARATSDLPVIVILDSDKDGREAFHHLEKISSKTGHWKKGVNLFQYADCIKDGLGDGFPWEAEDLWSQHILSAFVAANDESATLSEKVALPRHRGGWHYGLKLNAKVPFADFLDETATQSDALGWTRFFDLLHSAHGLG